MNGKIRVNAMTAKVLLDALQRVKAWPDEAQAELAALILEMEAGLGEGVYQATPEELAGIDKGLRAAAEGRFANEAEIDAIFAKFVGS